MADRYFLSGPSGGVEGPFDEEVVRGWVTAEQIRGDTQVCREGEQIWRPLSAIPELAPHDTALPPAPPAMETAGRVSFVGPILVTVFCCVIGGVVSMVYAAQANTAAAGGNLEAAVRYRHHARVWMLVSLGVGLVGSVLYLGLMLIGAMAGP
ncbi:MAG: CD225/dispanin family protein [bacterium]